MKSDILQYHITTENIVRPKLTSQQNMLIDGKYILLNCETYLCRFQKPKVTDKSKISYTEMDQGFAAVNDCFSLMLNHHCGLSKIRPEISGLSVTTWVGVQ